MNLNCGNYEVEKNSYEEVFLIKSRPESQQRTVMRSLNNATYVARCRSNWISIRYICTLASFRVARGAWHAGNAEGKGGVKVLTRDWHFLVPITLRVIMPHVPT